MTDGMRAIKHVVVVMFENRSFDNLVGYLYADRGNKPAHVLPADSAPTYDGLAYYSPQDPDNPFWNPTEAAYFSGGATGRVYAGRKADDYLVPDPDPEESFDDMTYQIFGPQPAEPTTPNTMKGFYLNYQKVSKTPEHIMQCYGPEQAGVLSALARGYALSDQWFASSPTQTWPNRAFAHLGTSCGRVNNGWYDPFDYDTATIFNTLEAQGIPWAVYNDSALISLTRLQFPKLWDPLLEGHFHGFERFKHDCAQGTLPAYAFLEPSFVVEPSDMHPPHDVLLGEQFLYETWQAVSRGKDWEQTLLVVTFDEHGGCYDHVVPSFAAAPPDAASDPGEEGFCFNRFGVRIPTLLISPYVEPGTVFRTDRTAPFTPYDHTSILATLRDWLQIPEGRMPPSRRTAAAPTFGHVLTRSTPRSELPSVPPPDLSRAIRHSDATPISDFQFGVVAAAAAYRLGARLERDRIAKLRDSVKTRGDAVVYLSDQARRLE